MRTTAMLGLVGGLLLACDPDGPVVPAVGVWSYDAGDLLSTTCADDLYRDPDATFGIVSSSATGFVATDGEEFSCTLTGRDFTCPSRRKLDVPVGDDTVITWNVVVSGRFRDPWHISGEQVFEITCAGSLCALDEAVLGYALPCAYAVSFDAFVR